VVCTLRLCLVLRIRVRADGAAGDGKETLAQAVSDFKISHSALAQRLARYKSIADWKQPSESAMRSSGWVVDTLEVALWGFFKYDSWADGALAVVNLGGDSDTAGAVYGGLAGAFYGVEAIPAAWVEGMHNWELIRRVADGVAELV
jgi:ADP-ribosyl-[dinitrogen reductase] hydrolase